MPTTLTVNGERVTLDIAPDTPLLWALRDDLGIVGVKYGCGVAACGACTVHVNGEAMRSCSVPVSSIEGATVTTVEGLATSSGLPKGALHPIQDAWIKHQVPQCGYCQSGMMMAVAALLKKHPKPTEAQVADAISNICRCGTYPRVTRAITDLAEKV
jgi:isoquinoline 1-oxidoreductase subunit alpha